MQERLWPGGTGTVCGASPGLRAGLIAENQWSA